jgi:hypothetical protein
MGRYNSDTLWRLYEIGGPDLALRYAELASTRSSYTEGTDSETSTELEVVDLRFFIGGSCAPEPAGRTFGSRFPESTTEFVHYQLDLKSPWKYTSVRYNVRARYYKPDGELLKEIEDAFETRPEQPRFSHTGGCGWKKAGNWATGTYRVEIDIDYRTRRSGEFTIFDDSAEELAKIRESLFNSAAPPWQTSWGLRGPLAPWDTPAGFPPSRRRRR